MIESLELHDRPGQLLGQPVVDFVGDELPFVIAGVQQVLEVAVFLRQCLFRTFAIRNVSMRTDESVGFTLLISQHKAMCHDPAVGTVLVTQTVLDSDRGRRARKKSLRNLRIQSRSSG